jgi:uncharacterized protein (TIGR02594 family)
MTAWLDRLEEYERSGFSEVPGPASNQVFLKWAHGAGHAEWVTDDVTPWCGIAMAGVLDECGLGAAVPKEPAAAISWLECGVPCEPKPGAIAVFPRTGGNHVTVIKRIDGHTWHCIGGNQSDSICTATFDGRTARGTRWPIVEKTPAEMTAESRIAAAAARQKRDQAVAGASGATIPATSSVPAPAAPEPATDGIKQSVESILQDFAWLKQVYIQVNDFAGFVGTKWWWIAGGIALYFLARSFWDSHWIQLWRTDDANKGYTP